MNLQLRDGDPGASIEPTDAELQIRAVLREREEARTNLDTFYRVVMKNEITKKPLTPAAHQTLLFSFVQHHDMTVVRMPINTAKTFSMAAASLFFLGNDVTTRGLVLSKTQQIAQKPLAMVSEYITEPSLNEDLRFVFPHLKRSARSTDPWTVTKITIDRPPAIRDASLQAAGLETGVQGSRLSWLVADDTLDIDNTATPEARKKAKNDLQGQILSRLDRDNPSRGVFTNTPWDRDDLTYYLEKEVGWPTLQMDIYGNIWIANADAAWLYEAERTLIRPSAFKRGYYRLRAHDVPSYDDAELVPLWPARFSYKLIEQIRKKTPPHMFACMYLCEPFDADSQRCQRDWVEKCKKRGMGLSLLERYNGSNRTFCGIDLAIGKSGRSDHTVFFVFELLPDKSRRILHVSSGRWSGPEITKRIGDLFDRYKCMLAVESNNAQDFIRQFAVHERKDVLISPHNTGKNKASVDFGVESIFAELQQEAWIIPCEIGTGDVDPEVQKWINDMLFYQPSKHTGDHLMASWIAREKSRSYGYADPAFVSHAHNEWLSQASRSGF